jgi:protein-S-isoprenylcysteine O-methyltransferase Ste14
MDNKLFIRYALREIMGVVVMAAALFISAGRLDWPQAWAALAIMLAWVITTALILLRIHPALIAERLGPRKGAKGWDVAIMSALGLLQLGRYILAGMDQRYGWTKAFPLGLQIGAFLVSAAGYALVTWATASNAFFSQIVRVQSERGQTVVSSGPYHWVRHPAYAGAILFEIAVPLLLGSWPAFCVSMGTVFLLLLRTYLEDYALQVELAGYTAYTRQVCFRIIPGIW